MVLGEAKGVLEFGAASQDLSHWKAQRHGMGRVAARTAQDALLAAKTRATESSTRVWMSRL